MKNQPQDGAVNALQALLRWVTLLENSSASVISSLPKYANSKEIDLREVEQGKQALMYIADSIKKESK